MIVFPKRTDKLETSSLKLQYQAFLEKDDLRNGKKQKHQAVHWRNYKLGSVGGYKKQRTLYYICNMMRRSKL